MGRRREEKKGCCTWPWIFGTVLALALASFLIWWFEPWKGFVGQDANGSENSSDQGDIKSTGTAKPIIVPTSAPTSATPQYQFIQCDGQKECCNGLEGICDLRVDEVLFATLHNAMATFEDGFLFGPNHQSPLEDALEVGYRGLNLDICNCGGEIIFCHGICALGPRDVVEVMQGVNEFLDRNPTELIVFIYQVDNNVDQDVDLNKFYDQLQLVDGLVDKLYVHSGPGNAWPTLGQLINPSVNKRIIMFHYNGPDCRADPGACPDGLHMYYQYAADNDWEHLNIGSIENRLNSCELKKNGINNYEFVGLNNFVSPPSRGTAEKLNSYSTATKYVDECSALINTDINFLLVDYWSEGDIPRVTQDHNAARALRRH